MRLTGYYECRDCDGAGEIARLDEEWGEEVLDNCQTCRGRGLVPSQASSEPEDYLDADESNV